MLYHDYCHDINNASNDRMKGMKLLNYHCSATRIVSKLHAIIDARFVSDVFYKSFLQLSAFSIVVLRFSINVFSE